jgi:hypothetical protein
MTKDSKKSAKSWYVSCSPRSPEKISPELKLMQDAEGLIWDGIYTKSLHLELGLSEKEFKLRKEEFTNRKKNNQRKIATRLAKLEDFKGVTHKKEINFSIRDRVAPMKTYGFLYTDSKHKLTITPAGNMIINGKRPKEVFLKQFLKWQYPSYQHGTARPHPNKYHPSQFNIFPFIVTLDLIYRLNGLTKYELAIFVLTIRKFETVPNVMKEIILFRKKLSMVSGKNPRKKFIRDYHYSRFNKIYYEEFNAGKKIREGKTKKSLKKYIETKMRNSYDIADSSVRYFRYSGLLSSKGNRVILMKDREQDIMEILNREYKIFPYDDVDKFYTYYGDYKKPKLKSEDSKTLKNRIFELDQTSKSKLLQIKKISLNHNGRMIEYGDLTNKDTEELKDIYYYLLQNMTLLNKELLVLQLQDESFIKENIIPDLKIFLKNNIEINTDVENKFIVDKNSVFEFVVWRAMIAIGGANNYKNNFIIDEELNIVHHAAGNQGDMEIYYKNFVILVEVTTSKGVTQFNMEKEPVTRHYEKLMEQNELPTYCLFIAKDINHNTYKEFFRYNKLRNTKIIPVELKEFILIVEKQAELLRNNKSINPENLKKLFDSITHIDKLDNYQHWIVIIKKEIEKYVSN